MKAATRVSELELAAINETNLSASQSPTQTNTWLPCKDGHTWRPQRNQAPSEQGSQAACNHDPAEAARLNDTARPELGGRFTAADRLHRRSEFLRIQRARVRSQTDHFVIYAARLSPSPRVKLGITVSRRLGNAVIRNRVKRRVREIFRRELRSKLPARTALVIIGRPGVAAASTKSLTHELDVAVTKLGQHLQNVHE